MQFPRSAGHNEAGQAARHYLCLHSRERSPPTPTHGWPYIALIPCPALSPTPAAWSSTHQRQVHEHLHPVARAHVSHVVEVGWIGYHFGSQFRVSEHLSAERKHLRFRKHPQALAGPSRHSSGPRGPSHRDHTHRRCCSLSSSGTLKTKRRLLRVRSICFLLLSEVSGTLRTVPVGAVTVATACIAVMPDPQTGRPAST